jgi:TRAP-type C4-dicarboxylate transport system permease small subunit
VAEEQVIKLLEEIRDLQKLHVENQKQALRRQKINLLVSSLLLVVFLAFMAYMGWSAVHPAGG